MGARWAWYAVCEKGHVFSNFSGGSDGVCDAVDGCEATVVREVQCPHFMGVDEDKCDCAERLKDDKEKPAPDILALLEALDNLAHDSTAGCTKDELRGFSCVGCDARAAAAWWRENRRGR